MINKKEIEKALLKRSGGLRGIRCVDGCYFPQGTKTPHQRWKPQSPKYTLYMNQLIQTLDMFHKYSKKENILYTLHAGSLAGFYWNGKAMPWDDDVDIIVSMDSFKKIIKHFFEDGMPRSTCKAKQSYSRRQDPKKNFRVKKVDGVLYEVCYRRKPRVKSGCEISYLLKIVPVDAVKRKIIGGLDITVCGEVNGKKIDHWTTPSNEYKGCVGPVSTDDPADFPEVDFAGIKTRAVVERLGFDQLNRMYGEDWVIPCHTELKKFFT